MRNIIITTSIVFLVNLILQISVNYFFTNKNGDIIITDPIKIDSIRFSQTIVILNYQKKTIENIEFTTNNGTISNIFANSTLQIKKVSNKKFILEKIYPSSNATIKIDFIKNIVENGDPYIYSLNHEDFSFDIQKTSEFKIEKFIKWVNILINCILISIIFGLFTHYFDLRTTELTNSVNELKGIVENRKKELLATDKKLDRFKESWSKLRILLMRRSRDLQTENDFYRSLISEIVKKTGKQLDEDEFQKIIRDHLKTYSTKTNFDLELDTIDIIANIIKEKDNK